MIWAQTVRSRDHSFKRVVEVCCISCVWIQMELNSCEWGGYGEAQVTWRTRWFVTKSHLGARHPETVWKRADTFKKYLAADWTTHLSISVCPGLTSDCENMFPSYKASSVALLWCYSGCANLWRSRHYRFSRWSSHLSPAHSVKGYWLVQTLRFRHKHIAQSLLRWIHEISWSCDLSFTLSNRCHHQEVEVEQDGSSGAWFTDEEAERYFKNSAANTKSIWTYKQHYRIFVLYF